jgi:uncharacterized protein DUF1259
MATSKQILLVLGALASMGPFSARSEDNVPSEYQQVLSALNRQGDFKDNVLKINIPRNDLKVSIEGAATPTAFGFGGWIAMTKGSEGREVMMGDLVLLEKEVNPVMSALLDNGLEVTALHNHFFFEEPRIFYMHVMGNGKAGDLARRVKPALDLIGRGASPGAGGNKAERPRMDTQKIAAIVGHQGEASGTVYKITVGRTDLKVKHMGAPVTARMGLNTWAAFAGTDSNAMVAGDVAMLESEVTPVLKTLRKHGIDVVAIHHHMIDTPPMIIFLHYWGKGPAERLATAFKAALDVLGKP